MPRDRTDSLVAGERNQLRRLIAIIESRGRITEQDGYFIATDEFWVFRELVEGPRRSRTVADHLKMTRDTIKAIEDRSNGAA
jgi:hypothetical protein